MNFDIIITKRRQKRKKFVMEDENYGNKKRLLLERTYR